MDFNSLRRLSFQAYFLGCTFDTWNPSLSFRLYVYTLIVIGYIIPLCTISTSYFLSYNQARTVRVELNTCRASSGGIEEDYPSNEEVKSERKRRREAFLRKVVKVRANLHMEQNRAIHWGNGVIHVCDFSHFSQGDWLFDIFVGVEIHDLQSKPGLRGLSQV